MQTEAKQILIASQDPAWSRSISRGLHLLGHQTCLAFNGCEVLTLLLRYPFDAMLIELDLPTINGLDVTNSVRRSEQGTGQHMAVIGLAQPWAEIDRDVLLECGLDGVLRRPFSEAELHQALQSVLAVMKQPQPVAADVEVSAGVETLHEVAEVETVEKVEGVEEVVKVPVSGETAMEKMEKMEQAAAAAALAELECVDREKLSEFIESDAELFAEMVELLVQEYPRRMAQIRAAIEQRDGKTLERGAHSLKGSLSYFCSKAIIDRLQHLENLGRAMDFSAATPLQTELEAAFPRLKKSLQARLATPSHSSSHTHTHAHAGAA